MIRRNFRNLLANNRWLKGVPTALTICNSLCGFCAILYTLHVYSAEEAPARVFAISAWIILCAMIFDALDGFAARILNAASVHGLQMDSLADMVTFGVAPAVLVAVMAHRLRELKTTDFYFIWCLCAVYLGCAAYRLATYNVYAMLEKKKGDKFSGLPSPGAAAGVCSLVIYYSISAKELKQILYILPIYAGVLGILMVSNIRYMHMGKWIQSVRKSFRRLILLLLILAALVKWPAASIVVIINLYILSGPFTEFFLRRQEKGERSKGLTSSFEI